MLDSKKFFTSDDLSKIEKKIQEAEKETSGELVVLVTKSSSRYLDIDAVLGLFAGILTALPISIYLGKNELYVFIFALIVLFFIFKYLFSKTLVIKKPFLSKERKEFEIREKAIIEFHNNGLSKTRDKTGILIMISLLEKKVYILADSGIYSQIGQPFLNDLAKKIARGIKTGKTVDSISEVIDNLLNYLKEYFPAKNDDIDELSNKVILD